MFFYDVSCRCCAAWVAHLFEAAYAYTLCRYNVIIYTNTAEPPIVDTPKSGQPPYNVCPLPTTVCMLEPPKKGQPPNNGQNTRPQCSEVPLYIHNVCDTLCLLLYSDFRVYICRRLHLTNSDTLKWTVQTFILGFPSLGLLKAKVNKTSR